MQLLRIAAAIALLAGTAFSFPKSKPSASISHYSNHTTGYHHPSTKHSHHPIATPSSKHGDKKHHTYKTHLSFSHHPSVTPSGNHSHHPTVTPSGNYTLHPIATGALRVRGDYHNPEEREEK
ncbi:hypothetical protein GQ53DRAFT_829533 [Thozetella sp. PMI_491]|nr:hypothetical protein GQ53DRAFT_829533 [Thozetella sp. PMI_491]